MTKKFAIIKGDVVDCVALADAPLETGALWVDLTGVSPEPCPTWIYKDGVFSEPPPPPPLPNIITKIAMITRFSDAEYTGILAAAKTDVEVQGWLDRFYAANNINLQDSRTVTGINMMVSKGLITQVRADAILNDTVQSNERPS